MADTEEDIITIDPMSVDQLAGAVVLILGAVGSLLLVIWQSKCHCKVNLCYIFSCERRPPNENEMINLKDQTKKIKKNLKKEDEPLNNEESVESSTPRLIPKTKSNMEPEPQAEQQEIDKLV
jgi:hypothetical protein